MLNYTVMYRSMDKKPYDNISENFSTIKSTLNIDYDDLYNITSSLKETNYTEYMTKPETLTLTALGNSTKLLSDLSGSITSIVKDSDLLDCAKHFGEVSPLSVVMPTETTDQFGETPVTQDNAEPSHEHRIILFTEGVTHSS